MKIDYKNRRVLEKDQNQDVSFMVEETDLNLQQDVIATKRELKKLNLQLEDLKSSYPLNVQKYLEVKGQIENLEKGLKYSIELQKELGFKVSE